MAYNPFQKPLGSPLTEDDLSILIKQKVAEGYFIEYKSAYPSNTKIGNSIASLANSYGGWYFIGIRTDNNHTASEIVGVESSDCPDSIGKLREIIKSHINPVPVFFPQAVTLESGRLLIAVHVPANQETPFVTRDGRIYRRVYDSSDPVPESDRHSLDRLFDNGRELRKSFERFCTDERTFSKSEDSAGWINIYLAPSPLGLIYKDHLLFTEEMEKLFRSTQTPVQLNLPNLADHTVTGNVPFNSVQPTNRSIVMRQVQKGSEPFNQLTAELFFDGRAKLMIPIRTYPKWTEQTIAQSLSPRAKATLAGIYKHNNAAYLRFFDVRQCAQAVMVLIGQYRHWIGADALFPQIQVSMEITGIWRGVPFLDTDEWAQYVDKFGLPIATKDNVRIPAEIGNGLTLPWGDKEPLEVRLFTYIGVEMGLSVDVLSHVISESLGFSNMPSK